MKARRLLIVGYGNPMRGDDALGRQAASRLAQRFAASGQIEVLSVHQLTLDLAEPVSACDLVIFLDARLAPQTGELFCASVTATAGTPNPLSHYCTPGELLATAAALYGTTPRAYLAGITTNAFETGAPLTPAVDAALDALEALIVALLANETGGG